jgi:hypothetical protein
MHSKIRGTALVLSLAALGACNSLLEVEVPGRVTADALTDPGLVPILHAAALQSAQCAYAQYVATGGMLAGESISSNGFVDNHPWEWRGIVEIQNAPGSCPAGRNATSMGYYTPAQQARFQLEDQIVRLTSFTDAQVPNRQLLLAEANAYAGYMYTILAEGMCEMTIDKGPKLTPAQVLAIADQKFTAAIAAATTANNASALNMARVGRARTRLDLGNLQGAAADAALVPAGFVRNAEFSETVTNRENRLFNLTVRNDFLSVHPDYRGLTVNGAPDPRVRVTDMRRIGPDNATPIWQQQKFIGSGAVPIPMASYAEAQLIVAEASAGQAAIDAMNRVRALSNIAPLPAFAAGTDVGALVMEERRRQLFSEGHRYNDMLRKRIAFQMGTNGVNRKGQVFSNMTCIPLPFVETRNNPNFPPG